MTFIQIFQIVIPVFLIIAILLQIQGSGLSRTFGGGGESFRSKQSIEKYLIWVTAFLAFFFAVITLLFASK